MNLNCFGSTVAATVGRAATVTGIVANAFLAKPLERLVQSSRLMVEN